MDALNASPESHAAIMARSRRQAMDWSLVLASQQIHPIIKPPGENPGWTLLVEPSQHERALQAIHQYRLENQGWSWRNELPGAQLELHWGALFWCLFLAFCHWVVTFIQPALLPAGRMDGEAVVGGAWWRLFTPILLHSDLAHLMANATFGVLILGLGMARFGPGITLLATFTAGALGNLPGILLYDPPYRNVGASGMMMGALGLLCVHSFGLWRKSPKAARYILSGVIAGFLMFVMFGFSPDSDIIAHIGGFVFGVVIGLILALFPEKELQRDVPNICCLVILIGTILLTWTLALR